MRNIKMSFVLYIYIFKIETGKIEKLDILCIYYPEHTYVNESRSSECNDYLRTIFLFIVSLLTQQYMASTVIIMLICIHDVINLNVIAMLSPFVCCEHKKDRKILSSLCMCTFEYKFNIFEYILQYCVWQYWLER